jgi:glycosyltransferase involved in cell wall biosynthesis
MSRQLKNVSTHARGTEGSPMRVPTLVVDGRVFGDQYPGVSHFWLPVLEGWGAQGGRGLVAHRRGCAPPALLVAAGFEPLALEHGARNPLGMAPSRRIVKTTGAAATLSPLYLTLDGAPHNLATVFDLTGRSSPRRQASRILWEATMRRTVRRASAIVCATECAASELQTAFPSTRGRTAVVPAVAPPPPHADPSILARHDLQPPFVVTIASHRPHKRLRELALTWRRMQPPLPLVLIGRGTSHLDAPPLVRGLGFLNDEAVQALLAAAGALVSASVAEGFGLPVLAALAGSVPVVATRQPALEEVAGGAALWLPVDDLSGLVSTAVDVALDRRHVVHEVVCGEERARGFTPLRAAEALDRVLHSVRAVR